MDDHNTSIDRDVLLKEKVDKLIASSNVNSRSRKACYPCNKRKVKCDREQGQPCSNCTKRSHPNLCFYEPDSTTSMSKTSVKRKIVGEPGATSPRLAPHGFDQTPMLASDLDIPLQDPVTPTSVWPMSQNDTDIQASSPLASVSQLRQRDDTPLTGHGSPDISCDSMTALVRDRARTSPQTIPVEIQPLFGLRDATAPYAFSDSDDLSKRVASLLPKQVDILKFFQIWKSVHSPFQAIVSDVDALEIQACNFVESVRENSVQTRFENLRGPELKQELSWLGLLLSVMALGARYSDLPPVERVHVSHEYTRKAFEFLRLANFLSRPSEVSIQVLLLLGIILQDEFQPDGAWALMGTTIRLAQSLGLNTSARYVNDSEQTISRKQKLWWAVVWQETMLSLCYGRPSNLFSGLGDPPGNSGTCAAQSSFVEAMYALTKIVGDALDPSLNCSRTTRVIAALRMIEGLDAKLPPRLVFKTQCRNLLDRLELQAFCIHRNFVTSYFLQLAIRDSKNFQDRRDLSRRCRVSSSTTARAFIDLASFSVLPLRSWSMLHNALSSVLLLGLLGEPDEQIRDLQCDFLKLLRELDQKSGELAPKVSERHFDAVKTLEKMCQQSTDLRAPETENFAENYTSSTTISGFASGLNSQGHPNSWIQLDGTITSPDDFWNAYFANPAVQDSDLDFLNLL